MSKVSASLFVAILIVVPITLASADQPGPDWMPMEQVKAQVMQSGYTEVTKLEADDGQWEGEGIKNGQKMEFNAERVSERMCKQVSVSLPYRGDSHDDRHDDYT